MARTNNRKAFTLVEMLVVIVIISMLVAMLVPAVIGARERARRVSCMNRMDQLGKGILQYESERGYLPGYVNQFGAANSVASRNNLSWVVVILENIGRADLWKEWRSGTRTPVSLSEAICPSDTERRGKSGVLSYAVNCGISDERTTDVPAYEGATGLDTTYEQSAWGLFFDRDKTNPNGLPPTKANPKMVQIGLDEIADGATQTIMLSENLNAGSWASDPITATGGVPIQQADVGVVWWSSATGLPTVAKVAEQAAINSELTNVRFRARPSSNHPGGVNVIFADGHSEFISDRVEYTVFRDQMISNQTVAGKYGLLVP